MVQPPRGMGWPNAAFQARLTSLGIAVVGKEHAKALPFLPHALHAGVVCVALHHEVRQHHVHADGHRKLAVRQLVAWALQVGVQCCQPLLVDQASLHAVGALEGWQALIAAAR